MITIEELDTTLKGISWDAVYTKYHPQDLLERVLNFTANLHTFLLSEGLYSVYHPSEGSPYQSIQVYHGPDAFQSTTVHVSCLAIYAGYNYYTSVYALLSSLRRDVERYELRIAINNERVAVYTYCNGCWYSDTWGEYCGLGKVMSTDCVDRLINKG